MNSPPQLQIKRANSSDKDSHVPTDPVYTEDVLHARNVTKADRKHDVLKKQFEDEQVQHVVLLLFFDVSPPLLLLCLRLRLSRALRVSVHPCKPSVPNRPSLAVAWVLSRSLHTYRTLCIRV